MNSHTDFCNYITSMHFLYRQNTEGGYVVQVLPRIKCVDGFSFSVQASKNHYCYPKNDDGPWDSFEVGYPSPMEPMLLPYIEDLGNPHTESVYTNVPIDIVLLIIDNHGGIA
jgi:hypothetical protein